MSLEKNDTIPALESFLTTLQTIQDYLCTHYPEAYKSLQQIISDDESSLKQEIQKYRQQLSQQAPNLDRDDDYINSFWYQFHMKIYQVREKLKLN